METVGVCIQLRENVELSLKSLHMEFKVTLILLRIMVVLEIAHLLVK